MTDWSSLAVSWAPLLVLVIVWLVIARGAGLRARGPSGRSMIQLYELQLEEIKRQAAALERLAAATEKLAARA